MLRVAQRAFDAGGVDWCGEAIAVLPSRFAALAHRNRDLILRAPGVALVDRIGGVIRGRGLDRGRRIEHARIRTGPRASVELLVTTAINADPKS